MSAIAAADVTDDPALTDLKVTLNVVLSEKAGFGLNGRYR
jgi:hypothetical protein